MSTATMGPADRSARETEPAYALPPDAALVAMDDGSARLLDMVDRFYSVTPVGATMLQRTLRDGPEAAAEEVASDYAIDLDRARADVRRFLAELEARGLLCRAGQAPRTRMAERLASWLLALVVGPLPFLKRRAGALLTLARCSLALFGWPATVAAWRRWFPLRAVTLHPQRAEALAEGITEEVCTAAAGNWLGADCKERALCCWALARGAGVPAALVIGVRHFPLSGHCWCAAGSRILADTPEYCGRYTPVLRYE